jgi:methionine sulfoxide reductase heme-binding subunit
VLVAAASAPTPMWYATRGSGYTALVLLSAAVVLGLLTTVRWSSPTWPRFLSQSLHRSVSLLALVFLVIHIVTSVVDPFARLGVADAFIPFIASYRPLWLGLGVISLELFLAVLATSLVRARLGFRVWQGVHLLTYASWPLAVLHGIGTGTDTKSAWALLLVVACVGAVAVAVVWRLVLGWPRFAALRTLGIGGSTAAVVALAAWTVGGPLQAGWARAAGTPLDLLSGGTQARSRTASAPRPLSVHLDDPVSGTLERSDISATATLNDQSDASLRLVVVANPDGSGSLTVTRNGAIICATGATLGEVVTATCGNVRVDVELFSGGASRVSGRLTTEPAR